MRAIAESIKSAPHWLRRMISGFLAGAMGKYRELFIISQVVMFTIGFAFWVEASLSGQAFSESTWGSFCLNFRAEVWAGLMMGQSALMYNGLINPVKRKMVAVGAAIAVWHFCVVGYSATFTGGEFVVGIYAFLFFVPWHALILAAAMHHGPD